MYHSLSIFNKGVPIDASEHSTINDRGPKLSHHCYAQFCSYTKPKIRCKLSTVHNKGDVYRYFSRVEIAFGTLLNPIYTYQIFIV